MLLSSRCLFLDVKLPETEPTLTLLYGSATLVAIFILTFWIVGIYWVAHHMILNVAGEVDRRLLYLHLLLLMTIVVIPWPTKLLAERAADQATLGLCAFILSMANLAGMAIWFRAILSTEEAKARAGHRNIALIHAAPILVYAGGVGLATIAPRLVLPLYVSVPVFFSLPSPRLEKRTKSAFAVLRPQVNGETTVT